ncbi:MAG: ABC transporter ATP-binding protein [Spirochaetales bacterium]|nr:ABC transporter ATP-binding protein [Spirochaetales bacterium]
MPPGGARGGFGRGHGPGAFAVPGEKAKDVKGSLRRLLAELRHSRWQLLAVLLLSAASTAFTVAGPRVLGSAITVLFEGIGGALRGEAGVDFARIARIILVLFALYLASALLGYATHWISAGVAQRTVRELRSRIDRKIARLPLSWLDGRTHGEILSRVTNDVDAIANTLQQSLAQVVIAAVTLVGSVAMMLSISWQLSLVAMATLPLYAFATRAIATRSKKYFKGQQVELGALNGHVEEMVSGHAIVKAFGREERSLADFDEVNGRLFEAGWKAQYLSGMIMPIMSFINNLGYVLIAVTGGVMAARGLLDLGSIQAFIQYAREFTQPIVQTANIANILQSTLAAAERVFEVLDEAEESADPADDGAPVARRGEIVFESIRFGYRSDRVLMDGLSLRADAGQTVAIVGPTGAGKTTLVNLLMRFYDVMDGSIKVDGRDIRELPRGKLRRAFGMVLQEAWLFHGSIRENIAYGREGASEAEIVAAAEAAHADHFIRTLPGGYDTVINEDATNISQGQKQLITIARAFLADPAVLILDEATSSVDTRTELLVRKGMERLMKGRTSFVIAHRLSTIRDAHTILVMNEGAIVEQGMHAELLAAKGFYAELYRSQFLGLDEEASA